MLHSVLPSYTDFCIGLFHDLFSLSLDLRNINTEYMRVSVFSVFSEYNQNFVRSRFIFLKMFDICQIWKLACYFWATFRTETSSERNFCAVSILGFLKVRSSGWSAWVICFPQGISGSFLVVISFVFTVLLFQTISHYSWQFTKWETEVLQNYLGPD